MEEQVEIVSSDIVRVEPPVRYEKSELLPAEKGNWFSRANPGYSVKTWRVVYRNEEEISRELLSHDYYQPTASVYQIGTGRLPTDPAEGTRKQRILLNLYPVFCMFKLSGKAIEKIFTSFSRDKLQPPRVTLRGQVQWNRHSRLAGLNWPAA